MSACRPTNSVQTRELHTRFHHLEYALSSLKHAVTSLVFILLPLFLFSPASAAEPLRISLSQTPLSLPFYVAESQGYFVDEGLPIKIIDTIGGHRTFQQLLEGTADLATSSEAVIMFNSFKHSDFAVIASFVSSDDDIKIITRAEAGINQPKQLAGKQVGTVTGSASHYYLETLLLLNGVNPKSVRIRNLQPEDMARALQQKEVDAIAIWEPFPFKALKAVAGSKVLTKSNAYRLTFNLIVNKKLLGSRDEELVKVLRALDRAEQFINTQPQQAKAILLNRLKLDQSFIDWIWPSYNFRLTLDQSLLTTLEGEARWARQEGLVKGNKSPNYLNFINAGPLSKVRATAVSIIR
ncbi:MAG: ABC transporter substrate-binding protein [Desulfuromonadaceae bacterium]|nr:ABC transporter substrate-binding protein [Desulfuromonadaceae bacterium]MDD2849330.1 ABC transporter substrate-binding protein [Desulfuromonadaceae bacterium]MDD4129389.1 ABC transporter substrate-binding protein [Desulfuromonadaceae bacterium]